LHFNAAAQKIRLLQISEYKDSVGARRFEASALCRAFLQAVSSATCQNFQHEIRFQNKRKQPWPREGRNCFLVQTEEVPSLKLSIWCCGNERRVQLAC
jgi:hypothetical protein